MPSAIANIIAKFIAQTETSRTCPETNSRPPAPSRPAVVSRSGRPAATSVPNASTSSTSVSGHESASDRIIAALLAWLKSDHIAAGPVSLTVTPGPEIRARRPSRRPAASTISRGGAPASPVTIAVRPSCDTVIPGRGGSTPRTAGSARRTAAARATASRAGGSVTRSRAPATTTCSAYVPRPGKRDSIARRACPDSEPGASQPAPESARSANGASVPSASTATPQTRTTSRRWSAAHAPSRPSAVADGSRPTRSCCVVRMRVVVMRPTVGSVRRARIGRTPDLRRRAYVPAMRPCRIANRLAWARLEAPIFV